jgi:POT family proton-dependent oligopeptide transporter
MWERFSYYGMRALLVLYLVDLHDGFGWSKAGASQLYGWYTALVYLTPVVGGYLADRFLGTHRSLIIGGAVIAAGHFSLALPIQSAFFVGLVLIVIGTGFFKANVSTMVGQLYREGDPRRDGAFTIFYMGINLGAFLGPLVCGYLAKSPRWGWHYGFAAAGIGMVLGLISYLVLKSRYLPGIGERPRRAPAADSAHPREEKRPLTPQERQRIIALLVISFFVIFFWMAFEQAGSSMNFFAEERTDRMVGGFDVPAPWFQSVNPAVILLFAPLFATLWLRLARRGTPMSAPAKMASGLLLLGAGFVVMVIGARLSDEGGRVNMGWLVATYVLHTFGELCLQPIGLSLVTKLAPVHLASLLMGIFMLANFFANLSAGFLAAATEKVARGEVFHLLGGQADFFLIFVVSSVLAGLGLFALTPKLKRLMHGRDV